MSFWHPLGSALLGDWHWLFRDALAFIERWAAGSPSPSGLIAN
ncbi:hypothetical protein [Ideonella sp. BN130291]|nr:hypothetical protein [Ideonella sp. BN130291]